MILVTVSVTVFLDGCEIVLQDKSNVKYKLVQLQSRIIFMQGYTVGVAGQTVNLLSLDSGSATLSPCTIL